MTWKYTLEGCTAYFSCMELRAVDKKRYREKFREHGINHHFLSSPFQLFVRVKTQEDANFVMLVFPGEFEIFESPDV